LVAPEYGRSVCAELLARINGRLGLGHFDLDFDDGELRFLTTVPLGPDGILSQEVIGEVIGGHHTVVDAFVPAIAAVLFTGMSPSRAMKLDVQKEAKALEARFSLN
jgi:hypothetical protein